MLCHPICNWLYVWHDSFISTVVHESCRRHQGVMSHIWKSHVTCTSSWRRATLQPLSTPTGRSRSRSRPLSHSRFNSRSSSRSRAFSLSLTDTLRSLALALSLSLSRVFCFRSQSLSLAFSRARACSHARMRARASSLFLFSSFFVFLLLYFSFAHRLTLACTRSLSLSSVCITYQCHTCVSYTRYMPSSEQWTVGITHLFVTWLIHVPCLDHMCAMTHSWVWRDSFARAIAQMSRQALCHCANV